MKCTVLIVNVVFYICLQSVGGPTVL